MQLLKIKLIFHMNVNSEMKVASEVQNSVSISAVSDSLSEPPEEMSDVKNTIEASNRRSNIISANDVRISLGNISNLVERDRLKPWCFIGQCKEALLKEFDSVIACVNCSKYFTFTNKPHTLRCFHNVCYECLNSVFITGQLFIDLVCKICSAEETPGQGFQNKKNWDIDNFLAFHNISIDYPLIQLVYSGFGKTIVDKEALENDSMEFNIIPSKRNREEQKGGSHEKKKETVIEEPEEVEENYDDDSFFKQTKLESRRPAQIYECSLCLDLYHKFNKPYILFNCHTLCKRCIVSRCIKFKPKAVLLRCPFDGSTKAVSQKKTYIRDIEALIEQELVPIKEDMELLKLVTSVYAEEAKLAAYKDILNDESLAKMEATSCLNCTLSFSVINAPYKLACGHRICRSCLESSYNESNDEEVVVQCEVDQKNFVFVKPKDQTKKPNTEEDNTNYFEMFLAVSLTRDYDLIEKICIFNEVNEQFLLRGGRRSVSPNEKMKNKVF